GGSDHRGCLSAERRQAGQVSLHPGARQAGRQVADEDASVFRHVARLSLIIWLSTSSTIGYLNGPPQPLLFRFQPYINPVASGGSPYIAYTQISHSLDVVLLGCLGAIMGRLLAAKGDRPNP